jgi:hypothetical protein
MAQMALPVAVNAVSAMINYRVCIARVGQSNVAIDLFGATPKLGQGTFTAEAHTIRFVCASRGLQSW